MSELVVSGHGQFQGNAKRLDRHNRDGTNRRADREVNEWIPLPIGRRDFVDHNYGEDDDHQAVNYEAY
jgi:hypothetical protein